MVPKSMLFGTEHPFVSCACCRAEAMASARCSPAQARVRVLPRRARSTSGVRARRYRGVARAASAMAGPVIPRPVSRHRRALVVPWPGARGRGGMPRRVTVPRRSGRGMSAPPRGDATTFAAPRSPPPVAVPRRDRALCVAPPLPSPLCRPGASASPGPGPSIHREWWHRGIHGERGYERGAFTVNASITPCTPHRVPAADPRPSGSWCSAAPVGQRSGPRARSRFAR